MAFSVIASHGHSLTKCFPIFFNRWMSRTVLIFKESCFKWHATYIAMSCERFKPNKIMYFLYCRHFKLRSLHENNSSFQEILQMLHCAGFITPLVLFYLHISISSHRKYITTSGEGLRWCFPTDTPKTASMYRHPSKVPSQNTRWFLVTSCCR